MMSSPRASEALGVSLALLVSLIAALPLLLGSGMVHTRAGGDSPFLLQRTQQLALALGEGVFPVRWMPDANLGLGYPAFNYYAALPYYVAAALHLAGMGLIAAIQTTQVLGFVIGGLAAYALGRSLKLGPAGALAGSASFTVAPFHLINVYVRGDSLSEFWAMGLAALCLYAVVSLRKSGLGAAALLAASYAALTLAHNITALLASPVLALVLLAVAWPNGRRWRLLALGVGALALGLLLSAWFWVPALAERDLVQLGQQTTGYFDFRGHFRGLAELVQGYLLHDYAISAENDPFCMGLAQALAATLGLMACAVRLKQREGRWVWLALAGGMVGATWLMTPHSRWLWERLPLLHYAQFPWRFLGLQAALAGPLVGLVAEAGKRQWQRWALAAMLAALLSVGGLGALRPDRLQVNAADITPERLMLFEAFSGNVGGTVRAEYLPASVTPRYYSSLQLLDRSLAPLPWTASGAAIHARLLERRAERQVWQIETAAAERIIFPTVFFPGWRATLDGQPLALEALDGAGLMALTLPGGAHRVELRLRPTAVRRTSAALSLLGGLLWLLLVGWWGASQPRHLKALGVGLLSLAMGVGWLAWRPVTPPAAAPLGGPLVMDLASYPYLHHEPDGLWLGQALLADYAYDSDTVTPGGELVIDLQWAQVAPQQTLQVRLMSLTGHMMEQSVVWQEVNAPIDATQMRLALALPATMPPGLYVPRLGVKLDEATLPIETAAGAPQSRASLAPVWVSRAHYGTGAGEPLALYGLPEKAPALALLDVTTTPIKDRQVEVRLTWRAESVPLQHYALSLRHVDAHGIEQSALDLAPMSPDYPTGWWRPGEVVAVRVLASEGRAAFEAGDAWHIVLYDRQTLAAIGSADVPVAFAD